MLRVFNLSVKSGANTFIDDRLSEFGCEMPILVNLEEFWGF